LTSTLLKKLKNNSKSCIQGHNRLSNRRIAIREPKIVVVIPTLNEEGGIGMVIDGIHEALNSYNYAVVLVDGHSSDETVQKGRDKGAFVIFQERSGYGDALRTGLQYAKNELDAEILVMMDADGTYPPADIPNLFSLILKDQADLVVGNRFLGMKKDSMTTVNRVGNNILSFIARKTLQLDIMDTQSGFRALRSNLIRTLELYSDGMSFAVEMLASAKRVGARILEIPVAYYPRIGKAKLRPIRDGFQILKTILRLALLSRGKTVYT
jgi:glycosyltransferase involved in cell wall biosynthesis